MEDGGTGTVIYDRGVKGTEGRGFKRDGTAHSIIAKDCASEKGTRNSGHNPSCVFIILSGGTSHILRLYTSDKHFYYL